jgi:CHAD domain-containing protein
LKQTHERELKFHIEPQFRLPELPGTPLRPRVFTSTYFDSLDHRLAHMGVTLRRRVERRKSAWQLKLPENAARLELEMPGPPGHPPDAMRDLLTAYTRGRDLVPVARLRTLRTGLRVRAGGAPVAEVVIDTVTALDGRRVVGRFRELEVELLEVGDEAILGRIADTLRVAGATDSDGRPKVFQVLGLELPKPPPPVAADAPAIEHLTAMLGKRLQEVLVHDPGTRRGVDPEDLHRMRVAVRRLRALLRAAKPMLGRKWVRKLRNRLEWLGDALGPVRDLDVLRDYLKSEAAALARAEQLALKPLLEALTAERARAQVRMLDALRSPRYGRLLERLEEAVERPRVVMADVALRAIAAEEYMRLQRSVLGHGPAPTGEELHATRIQGKRARYAAELAEAAVGPAATAFIRAAKEVQDILGEHQDAAVAEDRIRQFALHARDRRVLAAADKLIERQRARRQTARAALPAAWAELDARGREAWL